MHPWDKWAFHKPEEVDSAKSYWTLLKSVTALCILLTCLAPLDAAGDQHGCEHGLWVDPTQYSVSLGHSARHVIAIDLLCSPSHA